MKILAINISKDGTENSAKPMELQHYLKAVKLQPDRWKPGNAEAEKAIAKIPLAAVPIGTTPADVAAYEANKGKNAGKAQSRFELLLKAAESGTDISTADEELLQQNADLQESLSEVESEENQDDFENLITENVIKEKKSKYNPEDLLKLTLDKLQTIAEKEIKDPKLLALVLKAKKKQSIVDSIIQITKK